MNNESCLPIVSCHAQQMHCQPQSRSLTVYSTEQAGLAVASIARDVYITSRTKNAAKTLELPSSAE